MNTAIDAAWQAYYRERTPGLRRELMSCYLGLVKYVVSKWFTKIPPGMERQDLLHLGVIGLCEALERYQPSLGVKFETFAVPRIRGAIIDELRRQGGISRHLLSCSQKIQKAREDLQQAHHRDSVDAALAARLGVSDALYREWRWRLDSAATISIDRPAPRPGDRDCHRHLKDVSAADPLEKLEVAEVKALLVRRIKSLPEKYRLLVFLHYYEHLKFKDIGAVLNVSESRVSQMHSKIIERLRRGLEKREREG